MWALLLVWVLIGLIIKLLALLVEVWPFVVFAVVGIIAWYRVICPGLDDLMQGARDRRRHEQARREIDRIAFETSRAMYETAVAHGGFADLDDIIEGTAAELEARP